MAIDFKLDQSKGYFDFSIENGDYAKTDSIDTGVYMSVFCEKRTNKISEPSLRRGHFTNEFNAIAGYEIGSILWFYIDQAKQVNTNLHLIESAVNDGLRWLIDDEIISKTITKATIVNNELKIEVELINKLQSNSKYYNLFLNL